MLYTTAAQALLALAVNPDGIGQRAPLEESFRRVLRVAADACEHFDQAQADREAALLYAAELRSLLDQATAVLEAQPLPMEGGTWDGYMLAHKARTLLESEPLTTGHALRDELRATRAVARAATALIAAHQAGNPERIRMCEEALQQAVAGLKAAPNRAPIGPASI